MFVTKDISIWQTKYYVLYCPLFLECPCVLYLQGGHLAMFPIPWPLTSHLLPPQTPKRAMWGDSAGKWTLFFHAVYTSPAAELVWITSKTKRDIDKPNKNGGTQNLDQSVEADAWAFLRLKLQEETPKLILVIKSPSALFPAHELLLILWTPIQKPLPLNFPWPQPHLRKMSGSFVCDSVCVSLWSLY